MTMQFTVSAQDNSLHITADADTREDLRDAYERGGYLHAQGDFVEHARADGYEFVAPEWIGALTSAPILTDGYTLTDDGEHVVDGKVWWFPDYMVRDELRELIDTGEVTFAFAPADAEEPT